MSHENGVTDLVPHVPAALGGEVEELRRAVEGMRVSKCFFKGGKNATVVLTAWA